MKLYDVGDTGSYPFDFERGAGWRHAANIPHEAARVWLERHWDARVRERARQVTDGNKNYVVVDLMPFRMDVSLVVALYRHDFSTYVITREQVDE